MLKDFTFGQYFPFESLLHRMDPRAKILLTIAVIVLIFVSFNIVSLALMAVFGITVILLSKVPLKFYLKTLKPIWPFILLTAILNIFYIKGEVLFSIFGWVDVTKEGLIKSALIAVRIVLLVMISGVLTYTTSPTSLTDAIESLLTPLSKIGIDTHSFAMMMTIALRFIPTLIEETDKIMSAQKARGADLESGGVLSRIKALLPILIPLLISSFRRARELADAMECRCYHGGKGRTRMKRMHLAARDYLSFGAFFLLTAGVVVLNLFF